MPASDPELDLAAGDFSSWLRGMRSALADERGSDVPCGTCTACCTSSQFIHIGPDETDTLAHIPRDLLFPAPGLPSGHVLLGYDERGHCPMLVADECTIYEHRPSTCRTYDCRVLPAAGLDADGDQPRIARQVGRWRFTHPTSTDHVGHDAVRAAAAFLRGDRELGDVVPVRSTQLAVLAVEIHELFLTVDPRTGAVSSADPDPAEVRVEVRRRLRHREDGAEVVG
ncbi:MAG: YkgJ family cysteine cluster protein [Acidimicrobiales bacterium]